MVTILLGNTKGKLLGLREAAAVKALDHTLSYEVQGHQFMTTKGRWDGRHRLFDRQHTFPVGLLTSVMKILSQHGLQFKIQDNRGALEYGDSLDLDPNSGFTPRDYQINIVDEAWKHGSGIIRAATGAGKTLIIAMITARFNVRTVIYVIGIELLYQMKATLERAFPGMAIGLVGDGHCDVQDVTIATIWTAASALDCKVDLIDNDATVESAKSLKSLNKEVIKQMVKDAEMFILDECQFAGSNTCQYLHRNSISAKHRFLLSGTPWRDTGDDLLIEAIGGPKIYDLNASDLIDQGWLVPPKIHFLDVPAKKSGGKTYQELYKSYIVDNDERNELIFKATERLVERKRCVLILVTQIQHGNKLLKQFNSNFRVSNLDGSNTSAERLATIQEMKDGKLDVLVASKIFDQGIDIAELDGLVLAGSGKSSNRALQRIGRVIRTGPAHKKDAIVVDFLDNCKYLREHSQIRNKIYLTEPRFEIKMPKK